VFAYDDTLIAYIALPQGKDRRLLWSDWREALSVQRFSMGEAAALSLSKGMRRGQNSPVEKR